MAWDGFFSYAGNEIINAPRTEAYAESSPWFTPAFKNVALAMMLGETYSRPLQDEAPWVDPDNSDSLDFFGVYPLEVSGIEDSTRTSNVTESVLDGGVAGRLRHATKSIVFNAMLAGSSQAAVEYGMGWLKQALLGGACGDRGDTACAGAELCYLSSEPVLDLAYVQSEYPAYRLPTRTNLVPNPSFETDTVGWGPIRGVFNRVAGTGKQGAFVGRYIADGTTGGNYFQTSTTDRMSVVGTKTYTASFHATNPSVSRNWTPYIFWFNAAGSAATTASSAGVATTVPLGSSLTRISVTATAPADAVTAYIRLQCVGVNLPVNDAIDVDGVMLEQGVLGTYFDGDTVDTPFVNHIWTNLAHGSVSQAQGIDQPAVVDNTDLEDCLTPLLRTLHKVVFTSGPTVTAKRTLSDGSAVWTVSFTAVAGSPYETGAEIPVIAGFLDPEVEVPWAGGVVPEGGIIDLDGEIFTEVDCAPKAYEPIYDPNFIAVSPPPGPPNIPIGNYVPPVNWRRRQFTIPKQYIPLWGEVVPKISVHAVTEVRNLRLRFYADSFMVGSVIDDPCGYCGDILMSYIPADSTLTFDGVAQAVHITTPGGVRRRADSLVFATDGRPFEWPSLTCGHGYIATLDLPQQQVPPVVDLSLYHRNA